MDWFLLSIVGMILYGAQNFVYKVVAEKRLNSGLVLRSSFAAGAVFSGIFLFLGSGLEYSIDIMIFAIVQATFYLVSRYVQIESFKRLPAVVVLPISRIHFAMTAALGIVILKEAYTLNTILGILLFLAVMLILSGNDSSDGVKKKDFRAGIFLAIATAIFTTISEFMVKVAAMKYDVLAFLFLSYIWLVVPAHVLNLRLSNGKDNKRAAQIYGFLIGVFNFASFFAVMTALKAGPASVIFPIIGLNMLVTVFLSAIFYGEKITWLRIIALLLSLAAIVLLRQ